MRRSTMSHDGATLPNATSDAIGRFGPITKSPDPVRGQERKTRPGRGGQGKKRSDLRCFETEQTPGHATRRTGMAGNDSSAARHRTDLSPRQTGAVPPRYRWTRALPPFANASTSGKTARDTSPGNVVSKAPWAQPSRSASSGDLPSSNP